MPAVRRGRGILPAGGVTRGEKSGKFPVKNGVAGSIEPLDEADGAAALFGGVAEPLAATDRDAVVAGKAFVPAGCDELLPQGLLKKLTGTHGCSQKPPAAPSGRISGGGGITTAPANRFLLTG